MKKIFLLMTLLVAYCGYSQIVEAETGTFYKGAVAQSCGSCSGGQQAGDIGYNGSDSKYLTSVVNVSIPGIYTMSLSFVSGDSRYLYVSANGNEATMLSLKSADWSTVANQSFQLVLHQGTNTIKFYNDFGFAPNIDKFELTLFQAASSCADCYGPFEAESSVINAPAVVETCSTCSGGQQVGQLGYSDRYFTKDVTIATAGKYRIYISYSSGSTRSISVTANGGTTVSADCFSVDWGVVLVKAIDIDLTAGVNSLKFHTPGNWSPNIDKFRLELLTNNADLSDLKVNGNTISGFNAATTNYNFPIALNAAVPQITLATTSNSTASKVISQNANSSTVVVTASNGLITKTYTVNFLYSTISIESESGNRYQGAAENSCASCSNGSKVNDLGYNKYVINTVTVPTKGTYTLNLSYLSGSTRTIFISANGFNPIKKALNSGDWGTVATENIQIELEQGTNTIKFYNPSDFAPDLDKFTLALTQAASCNDCYGPFEAESGTVNAPATIQSCGTCSGGQQVGDMGYNDRFVTHTINVAKAGKYKLYFSYSSGENRSISITPNGIDSNTVSAICNSVDWGVVFVKNIDIDLIAGNNTLKFHTPGNWSPNFDKFKVELYDYSNSFEAEAGTVFNGAAVQGCATCSNGSRVGDIGNNRFLTTKVIVPTRGIYNLNISFTSGSTRTLFVTANGNTPVQADFNSGNWDTVGTKEIQLELYEGANTLKFYNDASNAPNIDKFTISLNQASSPCGVDCAGPIEAEDGVVNSPATIQNCGGCSGDKHVGDMGYSDRFVTSQVNIVNAGTYRVYLSYSTGDTRDISVTATQGPNNTTVSASCNSTDWGVTFVKTLDIVLTSGVNTFKFHNPSGWAPNIDKFSIERLTNNANMVDLKVNGSSLDGFNANTTTYSYNVATGSTIVPEISFAKTANASATKVITQATTVPGAATVIVSSSDGSSSKTYTVNYVFAALTANSWTGNVSNSWTTPANWNGGVPSINSEVVIGNTTINPIISSNVTIKELTIQANGILNINSGVNFTVTDLIDNEGILNIANNANLIQTNNVVNTGSGYATVFRNGTLLSRNDYALWSSPVADQNLLDFSPQTFVNRFHSYNESSNKYSIVANPGTTNFTIGAGYLIRMPNNSVDTPLKESFEGQFSGIPNNGTINKSINYTDSTKSYNLVGNPYPSTIDANEFIETNNSKIEGSLYFWRKVNQAMGSAYAVYNALGSTATPSSAVPNGTIQVGQGFFVKAKPSATTIDFTNAMRTGSSSTQFFKTKSTQKDRLWLNLSDKSGFLNQILIGYTKGASVNVDNLDAEYINDSNVALTSTIGNKEYSIQARPTFDANDIVALQFKNESAGNFTISLSNFDGAFAAGQEVYLVDSISGTETNLKEKAYDFFAELGTNSERFSLKFQKTLGTNENIFNENTVAITNKNGSMFVNSAKAAIDNIKVFDLQGKLVAQQSNVKNKTALINNLKSKNQVLVVKITFENKIVVSKKIFN